MSHVNRLCCPALLLTDQAHVSDYCRLGECVVVQVSALSDICHLLFWGYLMAALEALEVCYCFMNNTIFK